VGVSTWERRRLRRTRADRHHHDTLLTGLPPNTRFERAGAFAGLRVEWLEGSMSRVLDQTMRRAGWSARRSSANR
jgi:hypothetical protein